MISLPLNTANRKQALLVICATMVLAGGAISCHHPTTETTEKPAEASEPKVVYQSKQLVILELTPDAYVHVSTLKTDDFGAVPCNGLLVHHGKEVVVFDTPTNDTSASELIRWVTNVLNAKIVAVVPTHFHEDCLGGLTTFHSNSIPSYAYYKTINKAKEQHLPVPQNAIQDSLVLYTGSEALLVKYFGEGHTQDNIVAYYPKDKVLFGGCLIKELDATKGFLGDANTQVWSNTVAQVKSAFPQAHYVIPGHGAVGDTTLLNYTINLFQQ